MPAHRVADHIWSFGVDQMRRRGNGHELRPGDAVGDCLDHGQWGGGVLGAGDDQGGGADLTELSADVERGDGLPYWEATAMYRDGDGLSEQLCAVADVPATEPQETPHEDDAYSAIMCSDGAPVDWSVVG